jgi:hypothetical protein
LHERFVSRPIDARHRYRNGESLHWTR